MNKFKAGDKIRCIRGTDKLKQGTVYTFRQYVNSECIKVEENDYDWFEDRFELASQPEAAQEPKEGLIELHNPVINFELSYVEGKACLCITGDVSQEQVRKIFDTLYPKI